jgi:C-lobe and N-lobe beta barrels of Tf-binding protein B
MLGHTTFADDRAAQGLAANRTADGNALAAALHDPNGNPLRYNKNTNKFYYRFDDTPDASGHRDFYKNQAVDHKTDYFWNQLVPFMNAKANGGTKTDYREYRAYSNNTLDSRDEVLQVWAFKDSYATHYINGVASGLPKQQAWAFGGREATNVPTGGKGEYRGRWVATAVTSNFIKPDGAETDPNGKWMVQGNSRFIADFDTAKIDGTLTAESWTTNQNNKPLHTWFTAASGEPSKDTAADPNYDVIYDTQIKIDATLHNNGTAGSPNNQFTGTANLGGDYLSTDNPAYGGLYGTNGDELTGAFNVFGVLPQPMGGSTGIIDGREGHVKINGVFNANCTNPGGVCAP